MRKPMSLTGLAPDGSTFRVTVFTNAVSAVMEGNGRKDADQRGSSVVLGEKVIAVQDDYDEVVAQVVGSGENPHG